MCRWLGVNASGVATEFKMSVSEFMSSLLHEVGGIQVYLLFGT